MSSGSWVGSGNPGKWRKCYQWNVSKSRLGKEKLGLWCILPCPWIEWHRGEPSWFPLRYQGFGVYACPWIWRFSVWGWNRVLSTLYITVGSRCLYSSMKWIMAAMISSCGMFAYRDVTSAVTTSAFGGGGGVCGVFQWGWENVLCLWCAIWGC